MKTIFITGAAAGIGRATAELFASRGWFVGLADRDAQAIAALAEEIGPQRASAHPLDVSDYASARAALAAFVASRGNRLDVLHNNAGVVGVGAFETLTPEQHRRIIDINVTGVINMLHAAFPYLKETPGALVINMSSGSALYGLPDFASYSASKHAVGALTEALDIEWESHDIRVTDILPPFVRTAMVNDNIAATRLISRLGADTGPHDIAEEVWAQVGKPRLHRAVSAKLRLAAPFVRGLPSHITREILRRLSGHGRRTGRGLAGFLGVMLAVACLQPHAEATQLAGTVALADGTRVAGAMVSLTDANGHSITAYTDMLGAWQLDRPSAESPGNTGELTLRVRAGAAYADFTAPVDTGATTGKKPSAHGTVAATLPEPIVLRKLESVAEVSERLTASAHAASIRWESAGTKQDFVSQCQFCHQIGNAWTRKPRSEDEWSDVITRMEGYGSLITWKNETDFARTLSANFNGTPVRAVQTLSMHDSLPNARMHEWGFGGGLNYVHDIEDGKDGKLYGVDMSADGIWILDFRSNAIEFIQFPANGLPLGGMFSGAIAPMGTFAAHHGPHSIVRGPDGRMYMTCSLSAEICIFDPRTRRTEFVPIGQDAVYPHTLRFDRDGTLWFTLALSNQIGRMDVKTQRIVLIDLPSHGFSRWLSDALLPTGLKVASWFGKSDMQVKLSHHKFTGLGRDVLNVPYGIDINPVDGSVWYSKLLSGYIGRVDPQTLSVEEFPTPHSAPRRLRFDKAGTLWIPSFDTGHLMKFDARQRRFVADYKLPTLANNEYETPYALAVHPKTQQVWIASNMSDRILRFDPPSGTFSAFPSPTRVTFMRDFVFLDNGQVCTSNSNLPASSIEGGRPKFMCIETDVRP